LGNQLPLSVQGLVLCGRVPCELPKAVVQDAFAVSIGSHSIAPSSRVRDYRSDNHHVLNWPVLQMGDTSKGADILETPLAVDFSYLQSLDDSFLSQTSRM